MSGAVFSGDIFVGEVDADGALTSGIIGPLNCQKFSINVPDPDTKTRQSKQNDSYGQALDQIFAPKPTELELTFDDMGDATVLGYALNGVPSSYTQASGTITEVSYTCVKGDWVDTGWRSISAVTVKDSTGATTYTVGTDYVVGAEAGLIKILSSGTIASGTIKITLTHAALTGSSVGVGTRTNVQMRIFGDLLNLATNKRATVNVPKGKVSPSGGLDLLGSDFLAANLKGTALALTGQQPATITYRA